jgi:hypothetical protein
VAWIFARRGGIGPRADGAKNNAMRYASRRTIAVVCIAGWALLTAACGSSAPPYPPPSHGSSLPAPDVACDEYHGPNSAAPEVYQQQYLTLIVEPLDRDRTAYHSAIKSLDTQQIGDTAARLSDEMTSEIILFRRQATFGCYDQAILERLASTEVAFAGTLDEITSAARSGGGGEGGYVRRLVAKAKPQEESFVKNLNAYASQFGGKLVDQP